MFVMVVIVSMFVNEVKIMDRNKISELLENIIDKINETEFITNKRPDKIIIGYEIGYWLSSYFNFINFSDNIRSELFGIPIMIDHKDPWNVEVCICFKVDVNDESVCG